jgi:hypothetical protein
LAVLAGLVAVPWSSLECFLPAAGLRQALLNLLLNAIHALEGDGQALVQALGLLNGAWRSEIIAHTRLWAAAEASARRDMRVTVVTWSWWLVCSVPAC